MFRADRRHHDGWCNWLAAQGDRGHRQLHQAPFLLPAEPMTHVPELTLLLLAIEHSRVVQAFARQRTVDVWCDAEEMAEAIGLSNEVFTFLPHHQFNEPVAGSKEKRSMV